MNGRARRLRCMHSGLSRLWQDVVPDPSCVSVGRPQIPPRYGLVCPITGSRPVKSLCCHDHDAQLVVPGVDLARSPRRRADGREPSRDVSRRACASPLGCAAAVSQRGMVGRCTTAASIGAPAVPRRRRRDDSAGSQSRRGPVGTLGGRGGGRGSNGGTTGGHRGE